ncbi:Gfo/Idh/MocA family protein [Piscinibacter terrae]|uniref:Gfo/Idh/MocA family oxidoreductase n=1 Tax=Piscinibacter terrae TaxID=2496871 RepID=A0A3N7HIA0_9BURK|nr:Gfo/Idh/MocA family oxidoreductase [Albitalea terrae]RQP21764.1 gfo/Idh/MocA family oxidoreductase [Albitalea terrae]
MTSTSKPETGWGFIGASTIAREHMVQAINAQPGHRVVAVASSNEQRARDFAAHAGIANAYADVDRLLADPAVDVVYISTTNELHAPQAMAAAAAGKHVLCEKPLALSVGDALAMVSACQRAGVLLATNHHLRNAASHRAMRDAVRSGAIGQVQFARVFHAVHLPEHLQAWRINKPEAGGGVELDITVHDIDTLRFILAAEPVEAIGLGRQGGMAQKGLTDGVMAVVRFDNGTLVQLHDAFTVKHAGTGLELHGDAGSLIGRNVMTQQPVGDVTLVDANGSRTLDLRHQDLYVTGVRAFCKALAGQGEPAATGLDGVKSLSAALAVSQACATGAVVHIPNITGEGQ